MSDKKELPPETKFKIGDWVYYRDDIYKIVNFSHTWDGWNFIIEKEWSSRQIKVSDGDKYFRKA